jgi:DNA-binding response OmpR family regulator
MNQDTPVSFHSNLISASRQLLAAQNKKLLLVEDTAAHAALIRRVIDTSVWDLTHVTRGHDAIERFKEDDSYIILLDLSLPDYDGLTLLNHFKSCNPLAPVIIVTSLEDVKKSVQAMQVGAWDYVVKSDPDNFSENLGNAIEKAWHTRIDKVEKKLASECKVAELIKAEKIQAIEETIKHLCNEINNPLSGLITYTTLLKNQLTATDESEVLIQLIASAQKVASAVNKLQNISIDSNKEDGE